MDAVALDPNKNHSAYEQKKTDLLNQISEIFKLNSNEPSKLGLKKDTSNLFRTQKTSQKRIDVRAFNHVISVDAINLVAEIEGMATYEHIVSETLKYGCLPTVVPELKSITIGGALAGVGIESSSFRYGLVHETILEFEVLLGDGRIVTCTPNNEHKDLFFAFPNTYGTLGYALKIKVKLMPAKKYVKITHKFFNTTSEYFVYLEKICSRNSNPSSKPAYIDGVIFHKNRMYAIEGEFIDKAPSVSDYKYRNIYYKSIREKQIDYLTTEDYIWRWDPDWFWCSKHFFMQNAIARLLFGKFALKSTFYWKVKHFLNKNRLVNYLFNLIKGRTESVIQDIDIPVEHAEKFLIFFEKEIGIKPIWVCPIKPYQENVEFSFYKLNPNKLYINFGFWDFVYTDKPEGFYNKKIEAITQKLGGNKSLYSNVYYTETEFWAIYNKSLYSQLKEKYDPDNRLRNLYIKCTERQ